jgi:hypothetical protein
MGLPFLSSLQPKPGALMAPGLGEAIESLGKSIAMGEQLGQTARGWKLAAAGMLPAYIEAR